MPYSNELLSRIAEGSTRAQLRREGFSFSNDLFRALKPAASDPISRNRIADTAMEALRHGIKSNRTPTRNMLLPVGDEFASRYMYRARIIVQPSWSTDPNDAISIVGRFGDDRLLDGSTIRQRMEGIGEQAVDEQNRKSAGSDPFLGGRVRRIEILTTLQNTTA